MGRCIIMYIFPINLLYNFRKIKDGEKGVTVDVSYKPLYIFKFMKKTNSRKETGGLFFMSLLMSHP